MGHNLAISRNCFVDTRKLGVVATNLGSQNLLSRCYQLAHVYRMKRTTKHIGRYPSENVDSWLLLNKPINRSC